MSVGLLFWIVFIAAAALWLLGIVGPGRPSAVEIFVLIQLALLGWQVFGWPIKRGTTQEK